MLYTYYIDSNSDRQYINSVEKVIKSYMFDDFPKELMKVQYTESGNFITMEEWSHCRRVLNSYEIIFVLEGCIFIQQDDEKLSAGKGEIIILQPYKTHFGYQKSTGKTSFYWVHYLDPEMYTLYNIDPQLCINDTNHINLLIKQLLHIANTQDYPDYTLSLMVWLILTEIKAKQKSQSRTYSPVLKNLIEWIRINSEKKITVKDIANEFGYSEDYIARLFKKNFSVGIKEYINGMKMNLIKSLLISSNYSIKRIAYESGFKDYKNFLMFFRYHENMSPADFRNTYYNTYLNNK